MKEICGLIKKDLLNLSSYKISLLVMLVCVFAIGSAGEEMWRYIPIVMTTMLGMIALSTFSYDELAKSDEYVLSLPVNKKEIVLEKYILVIKLNYKTMPMSLIEEVDGKQSIRFVNQQILPNKTTAVEEAIIINVEDSILSIIEKRFMIDGKPGYYLNEQYIKGEPKLTDKQKMSIVNKVVKKVDSQYNVIDGDPLPVVKKELVDLVMEHRPVKPLELAKKVMGDDYNASEEVETIMKDLGIEEDDEIVNVPISLDRMSRCKLVLDDDRIIELNVEDYLDGIDIEKEIDENGKTKIILKNIQDIVVK